MDIAFDRCATGGLRECVEAVDLGVENDGKAFAVVGSCLRLDTCDDAAVADSSVLAVA
jgi:hypothetical protein